MARSQAMEPRILRDVVTVRPHPTVVRLDSLDAPDGAWITQSDCVTEDLRRHILTETPGATPGPSGPHRGSVRRRCRVIAGDQPAAARKGFSTVTP
jgi:hypothetical protein